MTTPFPVAVNDALYEILRYGILNARADSGTDGNPKRVFDELDHIHNLPGVLRHQTVEGLEYYFNVTRPRFLTAIGAGAKSGYEPFWRIIAASGLVDQR